jgi:hypothetical protein
VAVSTQDPPHNRLVAPTQVGASAGASFAVPVSPAVPVSSGVTSVSVVDPSRSTPVSSPPPPPSAFVMLRLVPQPARASATIEVARTRRADERCMDRPPAGILDPPEAERGSLKFGSLVVRAAAGVHSVIGLALGAPSPARPLGHADTLRRAWDEEPAGIFNGSA